MKNKKGIKYNIILLAVVLMLSNLTCKVSAQGELNTPNESKNVGITIETPSHQEVRDRWFNYNTRSNYSVNYYGLELISQSDQNIFEVQPNDELKTPGTINQIALEDTAHVLNTIRYSMGLKDIEFTENKNLLAQSASYLMNKNDGLSHKPATPFGFSDDDMVVVKGKEGARTSNLSRGSGIYGQMFVYIRDNVGEKNLKGVGHRRFLLNPDLRTAGVGQVGPYAAMQVIGSTTDKSDYVFTYPSVNAMLEYAPTGTPLSIHFGNNYDLSNAKVRVYKDGSSNPEIFTKDDGLNINNRYIGSSKILIFGKDIVRNVGTSLRIVVEGVTKDGQVYPIEYTQKFESLLKAPEQKPEEPKEEKPEEPKEEKPKEPKEEKPEEPKEEKPEEPKEEKPEEPKEEKPEEPKEEKPEEPKEEKPLDRENDGNKKGVRYVLDDVYIRPEKNSKEYLGIYGLNTPIYGVEDGNWFRFTYNNKPAYIANFMLREHKIQTGYLITNIAIRDISDSSIIGSTDIGMWVKDVSMEGNGVWMEIDYKGKKAKIAREYVGEKLVFNDIIYVRKDGENDGEVIGTTRIDEVIYGLRGKYWTEYRYKKNPNIRAFSATKYAMPID